MATLLRRARPLLGTVVEIGLSGPVGTAGCAVPAAGQAIDQAAHPPANPAANLAPVQPVRPTADGVAPCAAAANAALQAAFAAIQHAQACMSRFEPDSDLSRFHALAVGQRLALRPVTRQVLAAAQALRLASDGLFDISLGTAPDGWWLDGGWLEKRNSAVRLDLGGIGKGHAVDLAVQALQDHGAKAGWVNAGGDLRAFGDLDLPVQLRQAGGGVRPFVHLRDGAFATSAFGPGQRSRLVGRVMGQVVGPARPRPAQMHSTYGVATRSATGGRTGAGPWHAHVSVAAPMCLWADALTKLVAASGDPAHALLARHGASAWWHGQPG